ncbi:MAG TPA: hypothetical protein PL045_04335 [Chitinophagaceae bacterium]|nr:hypothetical protein [Chitinophagaceae bacterium]
MPLYEGNAVNLHTNENKKSVKKICLIVNLLLTIHFCAKAQQAGDSATNKKPVPNIYCQPFSFRSVPPNYYASQLGFFCKKEIQLQNAIRFPVKIRLGSVEYCDKLEGKLH